MRTILARVRKLERRTRGRSRAGAIADAGGVTLVWSKDDVRLAEDAAPGDVAVDVYRMGDVGGVPVVRTVERWRKDEDDLGYVYYGPECMVVGRVTYRDRSLIRTSEPGMAETEANA